jgi:hypothetical protein
MLARAQILTSAQYLLLTRRLEWFAAEMIGGGKRVEGVLNRAPAALPEIREPGLNQPLD